MKLLILSALLVLVGAGCAPQICDKVKKQWECGGMYEGCIEKTVCDL